MSTQAPRGVKRVRAPSKTDEGKDEPQKKAKKRVVKASSSNGSLTLPIPAKPVISKPSTDTPSIEIPKPPAVVSLGNVGCLCQKC